MTFSTNYDDPYRKVHNKKNIKKVRPDGTPRRRVELLMKAPLPIALAIVAALVARAAWQGPVFRLQSIVFEGQVHTDVVWLERVIRSEFSPNVLRLNLWRLKEVAESVSWVESAEIRRILPSTLKISLKERGPVALAKVEQDLFLIDERGVFLQRCDPSLGKYDLPIVRGLSNLQQENFAAENARKMRVVLSLLKDLDSGGARNSETISEIDVSEERHVAVIPLREAIPVYLGDGGYRRKYEIYLSKLTLLDELRQQYGPIVSVDFSVDDKIIYHHSSQQPKEKVSAGES